MLPAADGGEEGLDRDERSVHGCAAGRKGRGAVIADFRAEVEDATWGT